MSQAVPGHIYFYCFGGISLFIIFLQIVTGVVLAFFYEPDPKMATKSIEYLSNEVPYGWLVRNMHRWGSTLLIATIFTHMVTVFYRKAYRQPRELNWISGVLQFLVVFLLLTTGIILPWDWRAYWSFAIWMDYVATWPLIGEAFKNLMLDTFTMNRAFISHVMILPMFLFLLLRFHFKMVRKHGISEPL
ncbi:MAG: cytochrome b N-terminal domain-containing protein [Alphaproteobacteria bacterium]|jgi:menaquinol-cytochrome c reductase cytochrome b subunit|nr:cytochrome b N-terminal domain-containing protein [Alphaproteobacteria bacterium]